jgi:exopolysaccharide biosynthesis protein
MEENQMKHIRKKLSMLVIVTILLCISFSTANGNTNSIIYDIITKEIVTSGVTYEKISRFTDAGWRNINVLRVDLDNQNVRVDTLSNTESIQKLANVKTLAETNGAIAAINASFFNWMTEAGYGYADGPVVQSGKIISSDREYNRYNDSMGTFSISNLNEAMYNFWKTDMEIIAPNGASSIVFKYNKPNLDNYNTIAIYDRKWMLNSPGSSPESPNIVEMLVNENKVVEIRRGLPSTEIPENGYVVVGNGDNANFLAHNFNRGDLVTFNISTTPDWSETKMAVTGSAILVKDGSIPSKFSYVSGDTNGKRARTAIGSSRSGKELIMVTVDERQSLGMPLTELADLMISLGAYNALNLDGGGSTTMAVRERGKSNINIVNRPSDGSPRRVSTAIGVFSVFPTGALDGFDIDTVDTNIFVNTSREFSLIGYDKYFNPVQIKDAEIKWSVEGLEGDFENNTFYPTSEGEGTITATIGNISSSIDIRVLGNPSKLILNTRTLNITKGSTYSFMVKGTDKNGYTAPINPEDVNWSVSGSIGDVVDSVFAAKNSGVGTIDAFIEDVHTYCAVSVGEEYSVVIDEFENQNGTFASSPSETPGSYEISNKVKKEGNSSGKLTYDFTNLEGTRAAYLVFNDNGLLIDESSTRIGLWVYNPRENSNWLRAEMLDAKGQKKLLDLASTMNWSGWNYVETPLSNISLPAQLTRIYAVQVNPVPESGDIYLDNLTLTSSQYPEIDKDNIPQDIVAMDEANTQVELTPEDNAYKFNIFSLEGEPTNLLGKILHTRLADKSGPEVETLISLGEVSKSFSNTVNKQILKFDSQYRSIDKPNLKILQLNTSDKSLRTSASGQWQWFLDQLNNFNGENLFIIMKDSPKSFKDNLEADLFIKLLREHKEKTGCNIWLFYNGTSNESYMENGIRYSSLSTVTLNSLSPEDAGNSEYIEVIVNNDVPTYLYKAITQ